MPALGLERRPRRLIGASRRTSLPKVVFAGLAVLTALSACRNPAPQRQSEGIVDTESSDCSAEVCDDLDNDCDGVVDEDPADGETYYRDADGDGYGDPDVSIQACGPSEGWVRNGLDGDDGDERTPGSLRGDWPTFGGSPAHTSYFPGRLEGRVPIEAWSFEVGEAANQVAVEDGVVFLSSALSTPRVQALDAATGALLWRYDLGTVGRSVNPPTVHDNRVFVQDTNRDSTKLWALNSSDGSLLWSADQTSQSARNLAPVAADGMVWVTGGQFSGVYGHTASDGTELFFLAEDRLDHRTPAYISGVLYTWVKGLFTAYQPKTGEALWALDLGWGDAAETSDVSAALSEGAAYVVGHRDLYAIDLASKTLRWTAQGPFIGTPALANGVIYVSTGEDLASYDAESGSFLGAYLTGEQRLFDEFIVTDDALLVSGLEQSFVFELSSFKLLYTLPHGGRLSLSDGRLFLAGQDGRIMAYSWLLQ